MALAPAVVGGMGMRLVPKVSAEAERAAAKGVSKTPLVNYYEPKIGPSPLNQAAGGVGASGAETPLAKLIETIADNFASQHAREKALAELETLIGKGGPIAEAAAEELVKVALRNEYVVPSVEAAGALARSASPERIRRLLGLAWPADPLRPESNPYWAVVNALAKKANGEGLKILEEAAKAMAYPGVRKEAIEALARVGQQGEAALGRLAESAMTAEERMLALECSAAQSIFPIRLFLTRLTQETDQGVQSFVLRHLQRLASSSRSGAERAREALAAFANDPKWPPALRSIAREPLAK